MDGHEEISRKLFETLPEDQISVVMQGEHLCDIDAEFLGFVGIYEALSKIIPKHFNIIDLGCAYAPQCLYFSDHNSYVGVDVGVGDRFHTANTRHYTATIQDFIEIHRPAINGPCFAICSYVPDCHGLDKRVIADAFEDLFLFYPKGTPRSKIR